MNYLIYTAKRDIYSSYVTIRKNSEVKLYEINLVVGRKAIVRFSCDQAMYHSMNADTFYENFEIKND